MKVLLSSDVYLVILNHAFSTEAEEIMGLLFGKTDDNGNVFILSLCILQRRDKRKDRVEIAPEQLFEAMGAAEKVSKELREEVRVVGWYHSHPHITAMPSEVDIRTQRQYQQMDPGFVGLILALYSADAKTQVNTMDTIFFRADELCDRPRPGYELVPFHVLPDDKWNANLTPSCIGSLASIPKIILREETEANERIQRETADPSLASIHNCAVYQKNICKVMEGLMMPILKILAETSKASDREIEELQEAESH